jgi:ubiquinol oxidase
MIHTHDETMTEDLKEVTPHIHKHNESYTYIPRNIKDKLARGIVHFTATVTDFIFQGRYGHRAVVLETVAAVPGMVGGLLQHLISLRYIKDDKGWIRTLLNEAENERMHLLIYSEVAKPTVLERFGIMIVQFFFYNLYFFLYLLSPSTAHRAVGYLEEEAIHSYEHYLKLVVDGVYENTPAHSLAKEYWSLSDTALLSDVIKATLKDEMLHRDVNHRFADSLIRKNN